MIHDIPAYNYNTWAKVVEKLNRRALKLNCQPIELRIVRQYEVEKVTSDTHAKYMQQRLEIEVIGENPRYDGWTLLAVVEWLDNGENLVHIVRGRTVPEVYRTTDTRCDHCKCQRQRKRVFILSHKDGQFIQVGQQCLADFLGHVSAIVASAEEESAEEESLDARTSQHDIRKYLVTVAICIRRLGWLSRTMAEKQGEPYSNTTAMLAWQILTNPTSEKLHAEERDVKLVEETLAWARQYQGGSNYEYNLGVACRQETVSLKTVGIVASAISAYLKTVRKLTGKYVGKIGKRMDFILTVKRHHYFDSPFGVRTLIQFEDTAGNILIWWASRPQDIKDGDTVNVRATVKKHTEYKGQPQTELSRAVITSGSIN